VIHRHAFPDPEALAAALATAVAEDLVRGLAARDRAAIAVSGGSTPKRFFEALSEIDIDWPNVAVTLVDERWVPETSDRSNAGLVRRHLLRGAASAARLVPLVTGDETPEAGLAAAEAHVAGMALPFDAAILGMGTDGHTASFFPGGDNLEAALDVNGKSLLVPMHAAGAGEPRITLTLPVLLQSRALYLHIEGTDKLQVLERALEAGPVEELPVRAILHQDRADIAIFHTS
jgi:6-phosphogluconolactonase